jgi:hypothetical protein
MRDAPPFPPGHWSEQAVPEPQATEHWVLPWHWTVHPPCGQVTWQPLLPVHDAVLLEPSVSVQVLIPSQVIMPPAPVVSMHSLPPPHVEVQFEPQEPEHVDRPSHVVVQPVPQSTVHMFLEAHV